MFEREALAADVALKYPLVRQCEVPEEQVLQPISLDEPAGPHVVEGLPRGDGQVLEVSLWIDHLQPGHLLLEELGGEGQTQTLLPAHVGVGKYLLLDQDWSTRGPRLKADKKLFMPYFWHKRVGVSN